MLIPVSVTFAIPVGSTPRTNVAKIRQFVDAIQISDATVNYHTGPRFGIDGIPEVITRKSAILNFTKEVYDDDIIADECVDHPRILTTDATLFFTLCRDSIVKIGTYRYKKRTLPLCRRGSDPDEDSSNRQQIETYSCCHSGHPTPASILIAFIRRRISSGTRGRPSGNRSPSHRCVIARILSLSISCI